MATVPPLAAAPQRAPELARRSASQGPESTVRGSSGVRYRALFPLGRGGMGRVELAIEEAREAGQHLVALKRLLPESARDPRRKAMFLREAGLASRLSHPNLVRALGFSEVGDELLLALEYVEGETLSRVLARVRARREGVLPALSAWVMAEVCNGLHAAHELLDDHGTPLHVVHRDVSPHNVMVSYAGEVKVLDFGVAKIEALRDETRTGEVKGRMAYMSPEQAMGEPLDRRSDLFGIGAVLFECLAGRPMWEGQTDMEVMRRLALEEPARLDAICPDVPEALATLTARLVARDRQARPATAAEVSCELRAFLRSLPSAPDRQQVSAWMLRLFAEDARERQAQIATALSGLAAPSHAAPLRPARAPRSAAWRATLASAIAVAALGGAGAAAARALVGRSAPPLAAAQPAGSGSVETPTDPQPAGTAAGPQPAETPTDPQPAGTAAGPPPAGSAAGPRLEGAPGDPRLEGTPTDSRSLSSLRASEGPLTQATSASPRPSLKPKHPPEVAASSSAAPRKLPDVDPTPF